MRMPVTPPTIQDISRKLQDNPDRYERIFQVARNAGHEGKYTHWDKLRHLRPPRDLSHEEWWLALKLGRVGLLEELPLKDVKGQPFRFGLPDPAPEQLHHIDQDAGGRITMTEREIVNPDSRDRYIIHSLVEEAITSSQLEGAATTRPVAREMIRSNREPRDRSEQMILNNYKAMQAIRQLKPQPLDLDLILELHRILTTNTLDNPGAAGCLRMPSEQVQVVTPYNEILHAPPPAEELRARLAALCDFANGKTPSFFIHPVIRAIILHFWLAYDHPFVDGNGRCARGLFYWMMLRQEYWLCEFISISEIIKKTPAKYGRAFLYTETDENDLTYFILYHLRIICRAIEELRKYIAGKAAEVRRVEELIRASVYLNGRQMALMSHALRHPDSDYTILSHQRSHAVVYQTARSDLLDLERRGILQSRKVGRRLRFRAVPHLEDKLRRLR